MKILHFHECLANSILAINITSMGKIGVCLEIQAFIFWNRFNWTWKPDNPLLELRNAKYNLNKSSIALFKI